MELKSCPFCGGAIYARDELFNYTEKIISFDLKCDKCGTTFTGKAVWKGPHEEVDLGNCKTGITDLYQYEMLSGNCKAGIEIRATKRIDPSALDGKKPLSSGYKIFLPGWSSFNGYCYEGERGDVEGSVHTVTGELVIHKWGLHYCKSPIDCMKYRSLVPWNRFAFVEAYDKNINHQRLGESVCRTMKIVKVLSFEEMVAACNAHGNRRADNG